MVLKEFHKAVPDELRVEYKAGSLLRHERCGAVYDLQLDTYPHYLVSEYVQGQSLADNSEERSVDHLRAIAGDVLEALAYVHSKDLVHGDVTPANIIVSTEADGRAKLIDFGLATPAGHRPTGWNPRFAAPEVVRGDTASSASDLFGFAASLIFSMLGRRPFDTGNDGAIHVSPPTEDENRMWGADGTSLLSILFQGLRASPSDRPESATQMLDLINSIRATVPSSTEPADPRADLPAHPPEELVRHVNPNVDAVRRLYRASNAGNAGNRGLDDDFAKRTYVRTRLDTELLPQVLAGALDLVLLSGNPGDGKTSLLVKLGEELRANGAVVEDEDDAGWRLTLDGRLFIAVFDASESHGELSSDELLHQALRPAARAAEHPATALIAINDGRLLQFFDDYEDEYEQWSFEIRDHLEGRAVAGSRVAVVDLKRRALAGRTPELGLAASALAELTTAELWKDCATCQAKGVCPILANRDLLAGAGSQAFNDLVVVSHLRRRRRATFRDVRSTASWLLTGDRTCEDVHSLREEGLNPRLLPNAMAFDLAFSPSSGDYLINEWSNLDPGEVAAPALDTYRRSKDGGISTLRYASVKSVARAFYFEDFSAAGVDRRSVIPYRYLAEFAEMLCGSDPEWTRDRILLGVSRLVGAYGYDSGGLAVSSGMSDSTWAILHIIPAAEFDASVDDVQQRYVETMPDTLTLRHTSHARLDLTLDTAEIILRAADGELINDPASDAIRQEVETFVQKLSRQPSTSARIVDSAGSVAIAAIRDHTIHLDPA